MEEHDGLAGETNKQNGGHELLFGTAGNSHCAESHHYHNHSRHQPPVKKDAADIIVSDGRLLGAGSHAERPQEVVDKDVELLNIFGLCLQHAKNHLVPLPHALGVG